MCWSANARWFAVNWNGRQTFPHYGCAGTEGETWAQCAENLSPTRVVNGRDKQKSVEREAGLVAREVVGG